MTNEAISWSYSWFRKLILPLTRIDVIAYIDVQGPIGAYQKIACCFINSYRSWGWRWRCHRYHLFLSLSSESRRNFPFFRPKRNYEVIKQTAKTLHKPYFRGKYNHKSTTLTFRLVAVWMIGKLQRKNIKNSARIIFITPFDKSKKKRQTF